MKPPTLKVLALGAMIAASMLAAASPARADSPIWANARVVRAIQTDCGSLRTLTLKGNAINAPVAPAAAGCTSKEITFRQVNVAMAFLRPERKSMISESNVDAGTVVCSNGDTAVILGSARAINLAIRQHPAPRGCAYSMSRYQQVSSVGTIAFTDVANGGTMSVAESLALHAKERQQIIAECNASPACRAEVQRRSAINAYYECLKPTEATHTCTRPW